METYNKPSSLTSLSHELICSILQYLPIKEVLAVGMLCRKLSTAVSMHFRLCKSIDFCPHSVTDYMPSSITDDHLQALFKKCPLLEAVYGLHPWKIERRRLRKRSALTVPGIVDALSLCLNLKAVETCDLRLLEAVLQHLPQVEIIGHFQNRDYMFPPHASQKLKLQPYTQITSLHLIGVEIPELTAMPHLRHLHLQCIKFTKLQPFRAFLAHNLRSFVMKNCIGPSMALSYLSLIIALSSAVNLNHLELVRVPLPGGLFQRAVEDAHGSRGFCNLRTLVISGCKGVLEVDIGHLMIVASKKLETLYIQPSLTKDSLFVSLSYAQCSFPNLRNLHLGYIDSFNYSGEWSNEALVSIGLAEVPDTPSSITDSGMKVIGELLPRIKSLSVSNCPHLMVMYHWMPFPNRTGWTALTDLTLQKCHCLQLNAFATFVSMLQSVQVIILYEMFKEPPKGCSHVGLSAGTGLGMSSAVVSNQDEHLAVQGHPVQDFDHPMEEEAEVEVEIVDPDNEENQEPHFMVLRGDFFEEDDEADYMEYENQCIDEAVRRQNEGYFSDDSSDLEDDEHNSLGRYRSASGVDPKPSSSAPLSQLDSLGSAKVNPKANAKSADTAVTSSSNDIHSGSDRSSQSSDPAYIFDPHQPSTSKAGMHLDFQNNNCSPVLEVRRSDSREKDGKSFSSQNPEGSQSLPRRGQVARAKEIHLTSNNVLNGLGAHGTGSSKCSPNSPKQVHQSSKIDLGVTTETSPLLDSASDEKLQEDVLESSEDNVKNYRSDDFAKKRKFNTEETFDAKDEKLEKCSDQKVDGCGTSSRDILSRDGECLRKTAKPCRVNGENVKAETVPGEVLEPDLKITISADDTKPGNSSSNGRVTYESKRVPIGSECESVSSYELSCSSSQSKDEAKERNGGELGGTSPNFLTSSDEVSGSQGHCCSSWNKAQYGETGRSSPKADVEFDPPELVVDRNTKQDGQIVPCSVVLKRIKSEAHCEVPVKQESKVQASTSSKACKAVKDSPTKKTKEFPRKCDSKQLKTVYSKSSCSSTAGSSLDITTKRCFVSVERIQTTANSLPSTADVRDSNSSPYASACSCSIVCCPLDPNVPSTSKSVCAHLQEDFHKSSAGISNHSNSRSSGVSCKGTKRISSKKHAACSHGALKSNFPQIGSSKVKKSSSHSQRRSGRNRVRVHADDASLLFQNERSYVDVNFELVLRSGSSLDVKLDPNHIPRSINRHKKNLKSGRKKHSSLKFCRKKQSSSRGDGGNLRKGPSYQRLLSRSVVPVVSEGTQANSADIRRSVRRIRKVAAKAKRVSTSTRLSSFKSSRISARKVVKKTLDNRRPEMSDKATSTSDPLLEDDAVQVLRVNSGTLMSFTMVACGISDLIIDSCPELFHLEAQACRILKRTIISCCPNVQRLNISQCPKFTAQQLALSVCSLPNPDSYLLVSFEPCMQNYHPGEGEEAILLNMPKEATAVICHDIQEGSNESVQASMKDKMMGWLQYLSTAYAYLNFSLDNERKNSFSSVKKCPKSMHYPFEHDIKRIHGEYVFLLKSEFCHAVGRYQVLSNNPLFSEAFETHCLDKEFPSFTDCEATKNNNLYSPEAQEKHLMMNGIVGFYIPITEYNRIETYKLPVSE